VAGVSEFTRTAPEAAALLLEQLPAVELEELTGRWDYEAGPLPNFEGVTQLGKEDLIKIGRWKLDLRDNMGDRAAINRLHENANEKVAAVTGAAFDAVRSTPNFPSIAVAVLCTLRGVGVPMATTILTSFSPNDFGILDRRAWSCLVAVAPHLNKKNGAFLAEEVDYYETFLRCVSQECARLGVKLTCRDIDKALWQHSANETKRIPR